MKKNAVLVCKYKLGSVDDALPVLMEIKKRHEDIHFIVLFPDQKTYRINEINYDLWSGIQSLNAEIIVMRGKGKLGTMCRFIKTGIKMSFCKNIIFKMTDTIPAHKYFIYFVKKISDTIEIKIYLHRWHEEGIKNIELQQRLIRKRRKQELKQDLFEGHYDYFLSSVPSKLIKKVYDLVPPKNNFYEIGYTKSFPQWKNFLKQRIEKSDIIKSGNYCLYIMGALNKRIDVLNEPNLIDILEETLVVLNKYSDTLRTVFKPHAATDMKKFEEVLEKTRFSNYDIDNGHAMVLASGAKFVISFNFSTTMVDAYYLGVPIVEYSAIDPELSKIFNNRSIAGDVCDFYINRDVKLLDEVIRKIMNDEISVTRDKKFISQNFRNEFESIFKIINGFI